MAEQIATVEPTDGLYRPCLVRLRDGSGLDCVYLVEAQLWFDRWGVWPEDDQGKRYLNLEDVAAIADSPSRLPATIANTLYAGGETGMGYTIFTVRFRDGSYVAVVTGNAVDFITYPPGQSKETVVNALPHIGRDDPKRTQAPPYYWCLYERAGPAD
ncbi:hypothetical protein [Brevundimonas sp. Leaf363]|uniref:hypothetical protein n=1 Tax=Brevundimonas sp. Leaf363 TaxID=1736353 RepID=UPI0012E1D868|nr:hypothetical protein [Brevundimonas sp. Leaf363]